LRQTKDAGEECWLTAAAAGRRLTNGNGTHFCSAASAAAAAAAACCSRMKLAAFSVTVRVMGEAMEKEEEEEEELALLRDSSTFASTGGLSVAVCPVFTGALRWCRFERLDWLGGASCAGPGAVSVHRKSLTTPRERASKAPLELTSARVMHVWELCPLSKHE
jgi:hypothetical protein